MIRFRQEDDNLLEKEIATHSIILAGRIPGTEKPDGLQSIAVQGGTEQQFTDFCGALSLLSFFLLLFFNLFIYLVFVVAHRIFFSCAM